MFYALGFWETNFKKKFIVGQKPTLLVNKFFYTHVVTKYKKIMFF